MILEIRHKASGNCGCYACGKVQDGWKNHPYTVYHKDENEKRGHQDPVCSIECAHKQVEYYKKINAHFAK